MKPRTLFLDFDWVLLRVRVVALAGVGGRDSGPGSCSKSLEMRREERDSSFGGKMSFKVAVFAREGLGGGEVAIGDTGKLCLRSLEVVLGGGGGGRLGM